MLRARQTLATLGQRVRVKGARVTQRGHRVVRMTPDGLGFGNFLYLWLRADLRQEQGEDYRVVRVPTMDPWLELLPTVRDRLLIRREDVRPWDRRDPAWGQRFGEEFTREQLHYFIRRHLLPSELTAPVGSRGRTLTVNVRRGDYYSDPDLRVRYAFDIAGYVDQALARAVDVGGRVDQVLVVSDGIEWCRTSLDGLLSRDGAQVTYASAADSPMDHFRTVCTSSRIIGTNSTFSYWAAYVSNVLYGRESQVVMPAFHARHMDAGRAYQLDPSWDIIQDIPGGWDG